jgi:major type 1 subunit fimbrin (pilin)
MISFQSETIWRVVTQQMQSMHGHFAIRNPQSAIRNPQSAIRNLQSAIRNPQPAFDNPRLRAIAYWLNDVSSISRAPETLEGRHPL